MSKMSELFIETMNKEINYRTIRDYKTVVYEGHKWYIDHKNQILVRTDDYKVRQPFCLIPDDIKFENYGKSI